MIYTELTKMALEIAFKAHKKQKDKSGLPYIFHPYHLAEQMNDEISICVALLHDVVENTAMSFKDLKARGIPDMIIDTLKLLTHEKSVPYLEYVKRIKKSGNQIAIAVKLADLRHNSDETRLNSDGHWIDGAYIESVDPKTAKRMSMYKAAIDVLLQDKQEDVVYIEREMGTGVTGYKISVGDTIYCTSENLSFILQDSSNTIRTFDLIKKETFITAKNPSYKDITIIPGLVLEYPVFDEKNVEPIANMNLTFESEPFGTSIHEYYIFGENKESRRVFIDTSPKKPTDTVFLKQLPDNDITVKIYPDDSFKNDSHSIVDERYIVSMNESHLKWLHHIFHAYILYYLV